LSSIYIKKKNKSSEVIILKMAKQHNFHDVWAHTVLRGRHENTSIITCT